MATPDPRPRLTRPSVLRPRLVFFLAVIVALVIAAIESRPPHTLTIETGPVGGSYHQTALEYQKFLAPHGITVDIRPKPNSLEIVTDVAEPGSGIDIGFIAQDVSHVPHDRVFSVGQIQLQPLFVFASADLGRRSALNDLRGRRIAMPPANSATSGAAVRVLELYDITPENTSFSYVLITDVAKGLAEGKYDAGIFMLTPENDLIRSLAADTALRLVPFPEAKAIANHLPFLRQVVMPRGIYNIADAIPPADTPMVAATVGVVARAGLHPFLLYSLMDAMAEIHRSPTFLSGAGEFPTIAGGQLTVLPQAVQFYKSGMPWTYRELPPWLASLIDRYALVGLGIILISALFFSARALADLIGAMLEALALGYVGRSVTVVERTGHLPPGRRRMLHLCRRVLDVTSPGHDTGAVIERLDAMVPRSTAV